MAEQKFEINKIYTKDISAEAPNNPGIFKLTWEPGINLNLANNVVKLEEEGANEVTIKLTVTAKLEEKTAYIIEVEQSGVFTVSGFDKEQEEYMLGAIAPNILFPYARETISTLSQKAGFPAMLLNPIDFGTLFQQHKQQQADANSESGESTAEISEGEVRH